MKSWAGGGGSTISVVERPVSTCFRRLLWDSRTVTGFEAVTLCSLYAWKYVSGGRV